MTVLQILQTRFDSNTKQETIELAIEEVEYVVKNYCNIDTIPEALKFTLANMTEDLIRYRIASDTSQQGSGSIDNSQIHSLKIGDTTVTLGDGNSASRDLKSHTPDVDTVIMNYKAQLQKFRRMVW